MGIRSLLVTTVEKLGLTSQSTPTKKQRKKKKKKVEFHPKTFKIQKPHTGKFKPVQGYRKDLGMVFRSKMEANVFRVYKHLEKKFGRIKVEYEPELFTFPVNSNRAGITGYVPDIKILSASGVHYIEVKGSMDDTSRKKITLLSTYYPGVKLFIVGPKEYEAMKRSYAKDIPNWEW